MRVEALPTPPEVEHAVLAFARQSGLAYGSFDFAVDNEGRWWFLEVNPNGQWLWIEHATGLAIAAAIATALRRTPETTRPVALVPRDSSSSESSLAISVS